MSEGSAPREDWALFPPDGLGGGAGQAAHGSGPQARGLACPEACARSAAERSGLARPRVSPCPRGHGTAAAEYPACARRDCRCQALPGELSGGGAVSFKLTFRFVAV